LVVDGSPQEQPKKIRLHFMSFQKRTRPSIRQSYPKSISPDWKNTLKTRCLERVRQKRADTHSKKRREFSNHVHPLTNNANFGKTSRQLVEEQLQFSGVRVIPSSTSSTSIDAAAIPSFASLPLEAGDAFSRSVSFTPSCGTSTPTNSIFTQAFQTDLSETRPLETNLFPRKDNNNQVTIPFEQNNNCGYEGFNYIKEEELYELMQELEDELRQEAEGFMEEEMCAVEAEGLREAQFTQAQVEEYEKYFR